MTPETLMRLGVGAFLVGANAFFVASEFALTRLRQIPRDEMPDHPGLRRAWEMTERLELHLTGCQLGISVTTILLGVVAEPAVTSLLEPVARGVGIGPGPLPVVSVAVAVVLINLTHQIWGEQAPTYLGVERPVQVARVLAPILHVWSRILYPVIRVGDALAKATLRLFGVEMTRSWTRDGDEGAGEIRTHAELLREMGELLSRGRIPDDRRDEVLRTLAIGRVPVREIMVPRAEIVALPAGDPLSENLTRIARTGYVRYPLLGAHGEAFVGTVYVPALFGVLDELHRGERDLRDLAAPGVRVPANLPVSRFIDRLQDEAQEVALVEEDGRVVGLATVTDAFEEIAGELEDPTD